MKFNKNKTNGTKTKKQKIKTVKFKEIKDKKKGVKNKDTIIEFLKLGGMFGTEAVVNKLIKTVLKTSKVGKAATIIFGLVATMTEAIQVEKIALMLYTDKPKAKKSDKKSEEDFWNETNDILTGIIVMTKNLSDDDQSKVLELITNKLAEELSEEELLALADFIKNAKKGGDENDDDDIIDLDD